MSLPSKDEIRRYAIGKKATEQIIKMGSHTPITPEPEEMELKEAQLDIMRADKEALAEQEKYLQDMANEMNLKVVPRKEYEQFEKHGDLIWRHKRRLKTTIFEREKLRKMWLASEERHKTLERLTGFKLTDAGLFKRTNGWTKVEPKSKPSISLRKPLDIGSAIRGRPLPLPKLPKPILQLPIVKHKKHHIQRTSKTMRVLRKRVKDGQKVFSFPDRIWKVK